MKPTIHLVLLLTFESFFCHALPSYPREGVCLSITRFIYR